MVTDGRQKGGFARRDALSPERRSEIAQAAANARWENNPTKKVHQRRPHMSLRTKLNAALIALGLNPADVEFDHDPSLGMRSYDEATGKYTPDANDPKHIVPRSKAVHDIKTNGTHVPLSGDKSVIAKVKRIVVDQEAFRARQAGERPAPSKPKRTWPSRPFPKRKDKPWT